MLNFYNVRMKNGDDECWTGCEAASEKGAMNIANFMWKRPWRAQEARLQQPFYQELNADTEEEEQQKVENKQANTEKLAKVNAKAVITPQGEFPSLVAAARHYGIGGQAMRNKLNTQPNEFYFK